jgi:hypothetical protein
MDNNYKFAQRCNITGEGMNEGWVSENMWFFCKHESDAEKWAKDEGYASLEDAIDDEAIWWTEWDELAIIGWYESQHPDGQNAVWVNAK